MSKKLGHMVVAIAALIGGSIGGLWFPSLWQMLTIKAPLLDHLIVNIVIGAIVFAIISLLFKNHIIRTIQSVERTLEKKSPTFILFGSIGMIIGLVIGNLISSIFNYIKIPGISEVLPVVITIVAGYLGFRVGTQRPDSWKKITQQLRPQKLDSQVIERKENDYFRRYKILDTSVIIDGRIADVVKTHFLEGVLVVPLFVVHELQYIADSTDSLKRAKGRRGLDVLNEMQKGHDIAVEISDEDFEDIHEVDTKLIKLAKKYDGAVITNDYNLNKVAEFQNVPVLNINELANAVKPVVLPGETLHVLIVKVGTERQQGVAYLDDGTMIVVEDGKFYLNEVIEVVITSALQTAAGRMIFAKLAHAERKIKENNTL